VLFVSIGSLWLAKKFFGSTPMLGSVMAITPSDWALHHPEIALISISIQLIKKTREGYDDKTTYPGGCHNPKQAA
jgi:hypothetical protein